MKQLSQFDIVEQLGESKSGETWIALERDTNRKIILKRLSHPQLADPEIRAAVNQDLSNFARLGKNRIAAFDSILEQDWSYYAIRDYIDGINASEIAKGKKLATAGFLDYALQLAKCLNAIHAQELVHGNICASNIIITTDGTVRIVDCGLPLDYDRIQSKYPDNLSHFAPEQIVQRNLSSQSDLYSLGAVFFELLMGNRPKAKPEFSSEENNAIPTDIQLLVKKLLSHDPDEQIRNAEELKVTLEMISAEHHSMPQRVVLERGNWTPRAYLIAALVMLAFIVLWITEIWYFRQ
ncbi:MAG: protein kinase [candidate division Zixibacteria bacterium]|nr:protein kinase [candidate division Zixibacteria bacterium]